MLFYKILLPFPPKLAINLLIHFESGEITMAHLESIGNLAEKINANAEFLRAIAVHEAGHAAVAWSLGVKLKSVEIGLNGGLCVHSIKGLPYIDPELMDQRDWRNLEINAQILLGGEIAEMIQSESALLAGDGSVAELFGHAYESSIQATDPGSDREKLRLLVRDVFGGLGNASLDWICRVEQRTERTLLENWNRVCLLSSALLNEHSLSGHQATLIFQYPMPDWIEREFGAIQS